jgi:hypothetical protein
MSGFVVSSKLFSEPKHKRKEKTPFVKFFGRGERKISGSQDRPHLVVCL